jgi:hypothetical protein
MGRTKGPAVKTGPRRIQRLLLDPDRDASAFADEAFEISDPKPGKPADLNTRKTALIEPLSDGGFCAGEQLSSFFD